MKKDLLKNVFDGDRNDFIDRNNKNKIKAFILIELLVVVAIIGLLASIVLASLSSARASARDTRRKADLNQISKALNLFYDKNGNMPYNRKLEGQCQDDADGYYEAIIQELVDDGFLSYVPRDPGQGSYCYYLYNSEAVIKTKLETQSGVSPCWLGESGNWCTSDGHPEDWCICIPY